MKRLFLSVSTFLIFFLSLSASTNANSVNLKRSARLFIEKYCYSEFTGIQERFGIVKYSPKRKEIEEDIDPDFGGMVIDWEIDPIYVVSSYKILDVKVSENSAVATVRYKCLAKSEGTDYYYRIYKSKCDSNFIVQFNLTFDGNRWWAIDPPPALISKKSLIIYYEGDLSSYPQQLLPHQERGYNKMLEGLDFLRRLNCK